LIFITVAAAASFGDNRDFQAGKAKWWKNAILYEIFVRNFYDPEGTGIGSFKGVREKLGYLNSLGVTALWLMPIIECDGLNGYGSLDFMKPNHQLGSMDDFDSLVKDAHNLGIKIILDFGIFYTSPRHAWFKKSENKEGKYTDYYIWTNVNPSGWYGKWKYDDTRKEYFYSEEPALNVNNPDVYAEITNIISFWLDKGADGFRLDSAMYAVAESAGKEVNTESTKLFWEKFNAFVKSVNPDALLLGECWENDDRVSDYYRDGKCLDMCFDFDFADKALLTSIYHNANVKPLRDLVLHKLTLKPPMSFYSIFVSNHDKTRAMNQVNKDFQRAAMLAVITLTMPGMPMLYYGEEIGMFQGKAPIESMHPMQWNSAEPNDGFSTHAPNSWSTIVSTDSIYTVDYQEKDPASLLKLYKKLIRIRKDNPEISGENIEFLDKNSPTILSYIRSGASGNNSLVFINSSRTEMGLISNDSLTGNRYSNLINGSIIKITKDGIQLPPSGYMILKEIK
jgi:glycosidase